MSEEETGTGELPRPVRASWRTVEEVNVCPVHGNEPTGVEYRAIVLEYEHAGQEWATMLTVVEAEEYPPGDPIWS